MNTIYTDGSCLNNGFENARASWAIFHKEKKILISGLVPCNELQTNNTGELYAILKALALLSYLKEKDGLIISDSEYSIKSLSEWNIDKKIKGTQRKNYYLIKKIREIKESFNVIFQWVKGHSIDPYNDLVDQQARSELILTK